MKRRFQVPLNFSTDDSEYDYDYSYEEDNSSVNETAPKIPLASIHPIPPHLPNNRPAPIHPTPPHRDARSNMLRPIPKFKPNNSITRPQTSESTLNSQKNTDNTSHSEKNIIEQDPAFIDERFYIVEMKRFKSLFGSVHKRFLMSEHNQLIYDLTIKSKNKSIKLPNKHHLEISRGHTEFDLKSDEKFQKEVMKVSFYEPYENYECKRRTEVRFFNVKNFSLPRKLTSLGTLDDEKLKGHYHISSTRNTVLVAQNSKTPVFSILELEKDRVEIRTILNIDKEIIFALALASFLGKDCSGKTSLIQSLQGIPISPTLRPIMTHEKVII